MDQKPTTVWIIIGIVAAVGLYYMIYEGLFTIIGGGSFGLLAAIPSIILGLLTLIVAFLVYSGSGKTFLTILLVLAIIGNLIEVMLLAFIDSFIAEIEALIGEPIGSLGAAYFIQPIIFLVLAIVVFVLLYRPDVKAYFKAQN